MKEVAFVYSKHDSRVKAFNRFASQNYGGSKLDKTRYTVEQGGILFRFIAAGRPEGLLGREFTAVWIDEYVPRDVELLALSRARGRT